jgi:hypothetical protein
MLRSGLIFIAATVFFAGTANAQYYNNNRQNYGNTGQFGTGSNPNSHYVQPHVNNNGTYTNGYYKTNPNSNTLDNYGARGNVNPYNGQTGRRNPY